MEPKAGSKQRLALSLRGARILLVLLIFVASQGRILYFSQPSESQLFDHTTSVAPRSRSAVNYSFPRWGPGGIEFQPLLNYILRLPRETAERLAHVSNQTVKPEFFPETPYVWDEQGIWVSSCIRNRTSARPLRNRVLPTELAMQQAWRLLMDQSRPSSSLLSRRWSHLRKVVAVGVPFLLWYGDFRSPNCQLRQMQVSPFFTTCAHVSCTHALPFPNYQTVVDSLANSSDWDDVLRQQELATPWRNKIPKLVWRGSLTGSVFLEPEATPRYRLGLFSLEHANHSLLDIGVYHIPPAVARIIETGNQTSDLIVQLLRIQRHLTQPISKTDFSKYMAILDTDGNSWSSRFGSLLCTNSVVFKVEPQYVEYFYRYLQPFQHYIPVKSDLSDLLELVAWAVDPKNERAVLEIVRAANQWCRQHMTHDALAEDVLDILNEYVKYLDEGSSSWGELWQNSRAEVFGPKFEMRKISYREAMAEVNRQKRVTKRRFSARTLPLLHKPSEMGKAS